MLDSGSNTDTTHVFFELAAMALGGYSINIDKCCICGRKYMGQGTAVFRPDTGGIACMRCQEVTKMTPAMCPETVSAIGAIQKNISKNYSCNSSLTDFLCEIKPVLKLHREYRLERSPKSANYFE